jgi:IclR family acetate operon transcriptional repressor
MAKRASVISVAGASIRAYSQNVSDSRNEGAVTDLQRERLAPAARRTRSAAAGPKISQQGRKPPINRSVARALGLLLDVARNAKAQSFVDLQKRSRLPKSTLHKLLGTLETLNFLRRDEETGRYTVGLAAMEMAAQSAASLGDLNSILEPFLQRLVETWHETCHLGILHRGEEVILKRLDPASQVVRLATHVGSRHPAHATAGGLASLALTYDDAKLDALPAKLPQLTKNTIKTREELRLRLKEVQERGYAMDLEEAYVGVRCVGVAVAVKGWPVVHVSFSLPLQRASIERLRTLAKPLLAAAKEIEKILSFTPRN